MVPSIFSRRSAPEPEAPEASSTSTHPTTLVGSARDAWRSRLDQDIAADSTSLPTLSLSGAHPGGLAQLYTEHPVRLSLLIREPIALGRALERARSIIARSEQRASAHGTGPIHLGIGTASWRNGTDAVTVPALLRPVRLVRRDDDVLIAMGHDALLAPELAAALRERGEDIDSRDGYGHTPVHWRVMNRRIDQIPYLVSRGADINARDRDDRTPLFDAVRILEASDVERMISWGADARVVAKTRFHGKVRLTEHALGEEVFLDAPRALGVIRVLLAHGARTGKRERELLRSMDGLRCAFITHGHSGVPDSRFDEAVAALAQLCALFRVEQREAVPAPVLGERLVFDESATVGRQFDDLWDRLVPVSGQSASLQGEAIRIAGKVGYEVYDNGCVNWESSFDMLLDQFLSIVTSRTGLPPDGVERARAAVDSLKAQSMETQACDDLIRLAVRWARLNPVLIATDVPDVGR